MHGYIDPFYEAANPVHDPGHIWSDQPVYLPPRHGLKISRVDPTDDRNLDYEIVGRTADTFQHPPIFSMPLESTEAPVVSATKRDRPVVILGGSAASDFAPGRRHPTHHDIVWAIPIYGADQYDQETRRRLQIYDFRNAFYLPADAALGFDEGFARLDHAQPLRRHLLSSHRGLRLADDALDALVEWFIYFTTHRIDPESLILDYRREQTSDKT